MLLGLEFNYPFHYWQRVTLLVGQKASELRSTFTRLMNGQSHFPGQEGQTFVRPDDSRQRVDSDFSTPGRHASNKAILTHNALKVTEVMQPIVLSHTKLSIVSLDSSGDFCAIRDASGAILGTGKREFCDVLIKVLDS